MKSKSKLAFMLGWAAMAARGAVRLNDGTAHATIQSAVNAATNGDTLKIAFGNYPELVIISNKNLTLAGSYDAGFTSQGHGNSIVLGQQLGTTLWIISASCRVDRVSLTGGSGYLQNLWCGGGSLLHGSWVEFSDCRIYSNTASFGGGLFVGLDAYAKLTGATAVFSNAAVWSGGGAFVDGRCDLVHSNTAVYGNVANEGSGGGIWVETGYLRLFQGWVRENEARPGAGVPAAGGGIGAGGSFVEIGDGAVLWRNEAVRGGGLALFNSTGHLGRARLSDGYLGINKASEQGGGLYATGSVLLVKGLTLWGNEAVQQGGGLWLHSCSVESDTNGIVITQSGTEGHGGGWFMAGTTARVSRLIIGDDPASFGNNCGGHGGGLYATNSRIEMAGGLFQNNTALQPAGPPAGGLGGGAALFNSTMIITNATDYSDGYETPRFLQNHASTNDGRGGAIYVGPGSTLQSHEAEFAENSSYAGGAIQAEYATTECRRNTFTSNEAADHGGGLGMTAGTALMLGCRFEGNRAVRGNGGGVHAESAPGLQVVNSHLVGNVATNRGGGLYAYDSSVLVYVSPPPYYTAADAWPLLLRDNEAREGGAMVLHYCDSIVSHAAFIANSAPAYASGLCVIGGQAHIAHSLIKEGTQPAGSGGLPGAAIVFSGPVTGRVLFCTLADNLGDGLRLYNNAHVAVSNSILWGNADLNINTNAAAGETLLVRHSDIGGGWPGAGNIDADPEFYPNHHLRHGSPCINAGGALGSLYWPWDDTDVDGESRWADIPDMGFDEFRDSDGDRMPDLVETGSGAYVDEMDMGTDPNNPDSDGDDVSDGDEWIADTDPTQGGDHLRIISLAPSAGLPGGMDVTWVGGTQAEQVLEWTDRPGGTWQGGAPYPPPTLRTNQGSVAVSPATGLLFRVRAYRP